MALPAPAAASACRPVAGGRGAVAAAAPEAVTAGLGALADGGSAVDAAIAAQAALCVVAPHSCGVGGDVLLLMRTPDGTVAALNGTGAAPRTALPAYPPDGGASVTVPGIVQGWAEAHARWGRLPLRRDLAAAVALARDGVAVSAPLARAVDAQRRRLLQGGAAPWPLLAAAPGDRWVQPDLAGLLAAVAEEGPDAFYTGDVAAAVERAVRRDGGVLDAADLAARSVESPAPIAVAWAGGTLHVQPPMSQGVLLAAAAAEVDRRWSAGQAPSDHVLVELTEAAFAVRDRCGEGAGLLSEPLAVDEQRAARRGGPRAYLHTAGVAVADADGMVVSSLVSVFDDFGAGTFVPEGGFVLGNRAAGFTAAPNDGAPGKRPVHTLAPALLAGPDGTVTALATPGADGQVQTLLQVLVALRRGAALHEALHAPRWRSEGGRLLVEPGHPARDDLAARGHDVIDLPAGDDRFGAVVAAGTGLDSRPWAAGDWRRTVTAGAR